MAFIRTVLGDIDPDLLGVCYAHEHVYIGPCHATDTYPKLLLADVDRIVAELTDFRVAGGRAMIDSMPGGAGRDSAKLAEISRRSGVHIVCPTGLHLAKYYAPDYAVLHQSEADLARRFVNEITNRLDDSGALARAGLIKVASGRDRLSDLERRAFIAAAIAQRETGCPILTHTEQGTAAMEQIRLLADHGADLTHVVLSHTDRLPDRAYHRELLSTGVRLEYDSAFRWQAGNPTVDLLMELTHEFPDRIMLGMDAAKRAYWRHFGGTPGLTFLLENLAPRLRQAGMSDALLHRILVTTPAQTYSFVAQE